MNAPERPHEVDGGSVPAAPIFGSSIDIRSISLAVLAVIAVLFVMQWAQAVLIPITLAVLISYALMPIVGGFKRQRRLPVPAGAAVTLAAIIGALIFGITSLQPQALDLLDTLPQAAKKLDDALARTRADETSVVERIRKAINELEQAANSAGTSARERTKPQPDGKPIKVRDYLWLGTLTAVAGIGQAIAVVVLVYFLLVSGREFKAKIVRLSGDTLARRKISVQILDEIDNQIQRYLVVQVGTSILLGLLTWIAFAYIGLENAGFWGFAAGVVHLMPYVGAALIVFMTGVAAFLQFDRLDTVALVIGSSLLITGFIGLALVPWLTEKVGKINAVTVFVALLFWGWLWGVWGLLLGVPIMMALKAVCDRIEGLQPIAELLGAASSLRKAPAT